MYGEEFLYDDFRFLNHFDSVKIHIYERNKNLNTVFSKFRSIYSFLKRLDVGYASDDLRIDRVKELAAMYEREQRAMNEKNTEARGENLLSGTQIKNYVAWEDILAYRGENWSSNDKLLYAFLTLMPPRRMEYALLKVVKMSPEKAMRADRNFNYVVLNERGSPVLIIYNRYKTGKTYGQYLVNLVRKDEVPFMRQKLKVELSRYLESVRPIENGMLLFGRADGKVDGNFSQRIMKLFEGTGKNVGGNVLRHSFITWFLQNKPNVSDNELKEVALAMGHSLEMFRSYRKIVEEKGVIPLSGEGMETDEEESGEEVWGEMEGSRFFGERF